MPKQGSSSKSEETQPSKGTNMGRYLAISQATNSPSMGNPANCMVARNPNGYAFGASNRSRFLPFPLKCINVVVQPLAKKAKCINIDAQPQWKI